MQDKVKGRGEQIGGKAKEAMGKAVGDGSTEWSGKAEQMKGKAREKVGDVKQGMREGAEEDVVEEDLTEEDVAEGKTSRP